MNITTKQAVLLLAAAVIAQPFVSKTINNWGVYPTKAAAKAACQEWADEKGNIVLTYWNLSQRIRSCVNPSDENIFYGYEYIGVKEGQRLDGKRGEHQEQELTGKHWRF